MGKGLRELSCDSANPQTPVRPITSSALHQIFEGTHMTQRGAGQKSWPLSPYDVTVVYGKPGANQSANQNAAGQGADWFGPLQPITPLAPPEIAGRQWDFPSGYNLSTLPRIYEPITFGTLRGLADGYDLLRLVIETRKDQVARLDWTVAARSKKPGEDPRIDAIEAFFARPDGRHSFADWLRLLLEELFVIDAPALYMTRDRAGRLTGLLPIDGATIKPVIDDWGRTPQPYVEGGSTVYPVAYQQILKGYPAVDYSARDLLYRPRNIRINHAYGFSPVEQIVTSVNIALRRQTFILDYFTQGNIPDSLIGVPENWTPDQIASYQKYWDAYFDGDLTRRRRAKFVPGGVAKTFIQTKEPDLKSPFDDWLARIVCFAFSVSPQALVQQMNRATAQTQKELAQEEGLAPVLAWVKGLIDDLIAQEFGAPDIEFIWSADPAIDPQTQETILTSYATKGILTINEVRAALGREPLANATANEPMALTGTGYVALGATPPAANKAAGHVGKFNPYHDERGLFTTADGAGGAAVKPHGGGVHVAEITSDVMVGAGRASARTAPNQTLDQEPTTEQKPQIHFAQVTAKPGGFGIQIVPSPNPQDPLSLNAPIPPVEHQQIADALTQILKGNVAGLKPHPYDNYPHPDTFAELPFSASGYTALDVPNPNARGRGEQRLILENGTLNFYYTNNHYRSFYPIVLLPPSPASP
jgi:guanyl-specific ribonuclease Sa